MLTHERQQNRVKSGHTAETARSNRVHSQLVVTENPLMARQRSLGNQAVQRLLRSGTIQAKLKINEPGDRYEQEADRVAEQVMRMPDPRAMKEAAISEPLQRIGIQRMCSECEEELHRKPMKEEEPILEQAQPPHIQRMCSECEEELARQPVEEGILQTKQVPGQTTQPTPGIVGSNNTPRNGGQPLPHSVRAFFEPRFGYDFGHVRVHTDARAAELARAINALAYTVGRDVVFGPEQYTLGTAEGRKLLAHELTHVVQQAGGTAREPAPVDPSGNGQSSLVGPAATTTRRSVGVQRLVRRSLVNCPAGQNPFRADKRASELLDTAINRINAAQAARAANPADPDVVAVGDAAHTAFRLDPADNDTWTLGAPNVRLPVIQRRLQAVKDYIDSVVFTYDCAGLGCSTCAALGAGTEAFTCPGNVTGIALCPLFWARGNDQRGRVIVHEVAHITFGFIEDWAQPDLHNAHCYAQFVALLNGFNSPAGFTCH